MTATIWPWAALAGLGAFHGVNPAMGWLFAVALGLQTGERGAVARALPPIALGHAASIAMVALIVILAQTTVEPLPLQLAAAAVLVGFGLYRLQRGYRHRFGAGMLAGAGDLVVWSFLMATAHGAGLMIVPVLLKLPLCAAPGVALDAHATMMATLAGSLWTGLLAVAVHTAAMLVVAGAIAWLVLRWLGLAVLRSGWINLDLLWSTALIGVGAVFLGFIGAEVAL
ncbi:MAG TPA: hypothetical protein VF930_00760 [Stellaceae bacterium]